MRKRAFLPLAFCAISILGSVSCRNDVAWNASVQLNPEGWNYHEPATFLIDRAAYSPDPANRFEAMTAKATGDTIAQIRGQFQAILSLRYSQACNAREISLAVEQSSLDAPLRTDTLTFRLFSDSGTPLGSGRFGIYEISMPLPHPLTVSEGTSISVTPTAYAEEPSGFSDITLLLKK